MCLLHYVACGVRYLTTVMVDIYYPYEAPVVSVIAAPSPVHALISCSSAAMLVSSPQ